MIRRGTRASRLTALGIALGPFVIAFGAFAIWAISAWVSAGGRIAAAQEALHRIDARRSQAELYAPLGQSWADFAKSSPSGLVQAPNAVSARRALIQQVETLFANAEGGSGVVTITRAREVKPGLQVIKAEARGLLPEQALPAFLDALEGQEPFLFVESLDLRRAPGARGAAAMELTLRFAAYRMLGTGQ